MNSNQLKNNNKNPTNHLQNPIKNRQSESPIKNQLIKGTCSEWQIIN